MRFLKGKISERIQLRPTDGGISFFSDYFMPVLEVIFFRHAANRFEAVTTQIQENFEELGI
jgi:hypothetical protein